MTAAARITTDAPNIFPCLSYNEPLAAIEWLCRAFGFEKGLVVPDATGGVIHAELKFGPGGVMLGSAKAERGWLSPRDLPAVNQSIYVWVTDPDAHYARAMAAGATVVFDLANTDYGSRGYTARDLEGHMWSFGTYLPEVPG